MRHDPLLANARILGQYFVNRLNDKEHPLLIVGKIAYTKHQFVQKFGVGNILAANRLQQTANKLKINVIDFFSWSPREVAECGGLGTTCVYVLVAIAPFHHISVKDWYPNDVTFDTLKHQVKVASEDADKAKTAKAKRHAALAKAGDHVMSKKRTERPRLAAAS